MKYFHRVASQRYVLSKMFKLSPAVRSNASRAPDSVYCREMTNCLLDIVEALPSICHNVLVLHLKLIPILAFVDLGIYLALAYRAPFPPSKPERAPFITTPELVSSQGHRLLSDY